MLLIAAIVSFFVVSQLRGPDQFTEQLELESEGDLTRILASLSAESTSLQEELAALKIELADVQNSSESEGAAAEQAAEQLNALEVLAGTVPVSGPGIEMAIDDPDQQVQFDAMVDAVQELRDAGAEAISINGRRVGVSSSFGQRGTEITLDDVALQRPLSISAIGPAATMEGGLQIPGGSLDTLRALAGVEVTVSRSNSLNIPALEEAPVFQAARPVESD
jgi:uncharacterized protein YlxW (UPF0749 family)